MTCSHSTCETPFCPWCGATMNPDAIGIQLKGFCINQRRHPRDGEGPDGETVKQNDFWVRCAHWIETQLQRNREAGR